MELGGSEALPGAVVQAQGLSLSARSDGRGRYEISLPAGSAALAFSAENFAPKALKFELKPGEKLSRNIYLERSSLESGEYRVRGHREAPQISVESMDQEEIRKLPGTAGDALRALRALPGVVTVGGDYSGRLVIRGGGPEDNLYLLDNFPWPIPYHLGGVVSTVHPDLLSDVDINASCFGARWGDVQGAVLDASTRPGRKDGFHGQADLSIIMSSLLLEGPLGFGDASFVLTGRRSYLDFILPHILDPAILGDLPLYWDFQLSLDWNPGPRNHLRALAMVSDDELNFSLGTSDTDRPDFLGKGYQQNAFKSFGLSWDNRALKNFRSIFTPYAYQTDFILDFGAGYNQNLSTKIAGFKEEADWEAGKFLGIGHDFGFGGGLEKQFIDAKGYALSRDSGSQGGWAVPSVPIHFDLRPQPLLRYAYLQDRLSLWPGLSLSLGLRYDKSDLVAGDTLEPRLSLEWKPGPKDTFRAAWGLYDQFPAGQELLEPFGNPGLSANRAEQLGAGYERVLGSGLSARLEAYYKSFSSQVVSLAPPAQPYDNRGYGDSRGIEVFIRQGLSQRFFGWISYAYSVSERANDPDPDWHLFPYDTSHVLNLMASYQLSPKWSLGSLLRYSSGPLYTPVVRRVPDPSSLSGYDAVFGAPYSSRLGDYLRWDLRTDYSWLYAGWKLSLYLEILNALNRANPAYADYDPRTGNQIVRNNLPLLPNLGLQASF
jgi:hypothetical protein